MARQLQKAVANQERLALHVFLARLLNGMCLACLDAWLNY